MRAPTDRVHRVGGSDTMVEANGTLDGEEVLPGFALPLSTIFR
jgi:hypothetical protein